MNRFIKAWKVWAIFLLTFSLIYSGAVIASTLKEFDAFSLHGFKQAATFFSLESNVITETKFRDYRPVDLGSTTQSDLQSRNLVNSFVEDFDSISSGELPNIISKIPAQVPKDVRSCATSNGLNKQLISVNLVRFKDKDAFVFVNQSNLNANGLSFSIFDNVCALSFNEDYIKSSKAFIRIRSLSTGLEESHLPGHFAMFDNRAYLLDKYANLYIFGIEELQKGLRLNRSAKIVTNPKSKLENASNTQGFGVKGVHINNGMLYFSVAEEISGCLKLNVYQLALPKKADNSPRIKASIFYSMPSCYNQNTANLGASGGKMITSQDTTSMILSLGNASIWTGNEDIVIDKSIGNILAINYETGAVQVVSTGHRNPQGMCLFEGQLFSTEQGPEGGDEFNKITSGADYGWPFVTLGHPYGNSVNPAARTKSFAVGGYVAPILSWSPSIASGDLECPTKEVIGPWDDSFLVATLRDKSIRRLIMYHDRVISEERIPLSKRIRNIERSGASSYLLFTDDGTLLDVHLLSLVSAS